MATTYPVDGSHPNIQALRAIYADLTRVGEYATDDIVLHRADRTVDNPHFVTGREQVVAHEAALVATTDKTIVMDVEHIAANDYFGAVFGVLRIQHPQPAAMPFCGLWRFENGKITEHWENAYDAPEFLRVLTQPVSAD
ncbi:nuclear transport factor 2 family protein [Amycolatopsis speibonae]|uniref:Nuclear transport factor 2 family protein n=1 Tax=Amycolatopsis speibonae TaxID=1450224 RepID=A0ABV7P2A9_9PSEU